MDYLSKRYHKNPSVISRAVGNETVLVPIQNNTANLEEIFMLNETSGRIWGCIDGKNSVAEIKKIITDEFNVTPREAQADLLSLIK
ncbi:MAG: PqqD family protein [Candidatus Omnitrophica bacterium]|nr:PqqD family protein [Candidatus Omnitrophota bacterium]